MHKVVVGLLAAFVILDAVASTVRAAEYSPLSLSIDPKYLSAGGGARSVAADTSVRLRAYGIYSKTSGTYEVSPTITGAEHVLDLEDTLGMSTNKFTGGVLLGFNFGSENRMHLDLSYDGYYDYDGSETVGSISFGGKVYTAGVDSSLRFHSGAVMFGYDLWKSDDTGLTFTGNLGVRIFDIDTEIREQLTNQSGSWELWAPVPVLGGTLRWDMTPNLYVKGTANGMYFGELGCFADLSAEVGYDFNKNLGVFLGCRLWSVRIDYNDDSLDIVNQAIYGGVELRM